MVAAAANSRDEFKKKVRDRLAERAGHQCSNPDCRAPTSGPQVQEDASSVKVGRGSHITAAAPGGPRYDASLTPGQRSAQSNGVWLCAVCADKVDKDEAGYPVALLRQWKEDAEAEARRRLGKSASAGSESTGATKRTAGRRRAAKLSALLSALAVVSYLADFGGARTQMREWGIGAGLIREFQTASPGEILIIVASFYRSEGVVGTEAHREVADALKAAFASAAPSVTVRVEVSSVQLRTGETERARTLGRRYRAGMVIWGDDTGARSSYSTLNLMVRNSQVCTISNVERAYLRDPRAYSTYVTHERPSELAVTSLIRVGSVLYSKDQYGDAIRLFEQVTVSLAPSQLLTLVQSLLTHAYNERGIEAALADHAAEALSDFTLALKYAEAVPAPSSVYAAQTNLGIAYFNSGDPTAGFREVDRAIALMPTVAAAYVSRAALHGARSEADLARADLNKAVQLEPQAVAVRKSRADFLVGQGEYASALEDCDAAIASSPGDSEAHSCRAAVFLAEARTAEAETALKRATELGSLNWCDFLRLGNMLYGRGDYRGALAKYDQAVQLGPDEARAIASRGRALLALGRTKEACAAYQMATQLEPNDPRFHRDHGSALFQLRRFEEAVSAYDAAITLQPQDAGTYLGRGLAYHRLGRADDAIRDLTRAIELQPENAWRYVNRGFVFHELGRNDEAIRDSTRAIELDPTLRSAYDLRSLAYSEKGDKTRALADYQAARKLQEDGVGATSSAEAPVPRDP